MQLPHNELVAEAEGVDPLVQLLELVEMAVEEQELKELGQPQCQLQQQEPQILEAAEAAVEIVL
tara:strand:+ start:421 stop:612 length:192 start_codon:yes stop_codon:yes gene_type:complete